MDSLINEYVSGVVAQVHQSRLSELSEFPISSKADKEEHLEKFLTYLKDEVAVTVETIHKRLLETVVADRSLLWWITYFELLKNGVIQELEYARLELDEKTDDELQESILDHEFLTTMKRKYIDDLRYAKNLIDSSLQSISTIGEVDEL